MGIKKALKVISSISGMKLGDLEGTDLQEILEALAEPDEEELKPGRVHWVKPGDEMRYVTCGCPPKESAFEFGDLVEDKDGIRLIVQESNDGQSCWVLRTIGPGRRFIGCSRDIKDLKLIQRGFCDVSLGRIRDKLIERLVAPSHLGDRPTPTLPPPPDLRGATLKKGENDV